MSTETTNDNIKWSHEMIKMMEDSVSIENCPTFLDEIPDEEVIDMIVEDYLNMKEGK